jgi:cyclopropane fatty-acyl-phospholipid synthase-like methyltransferase
MNYIAGGTTMGIKKYVLEGIEEFERLEQQSRQKHYNFQAELKAFRTPIKGPILDAGCGSGVVARNLIQLYPDQIIHACDASPTRIEQAKGINNPNIEFFTANLKLLSDHTQTKYNSIFCRYVTHHLSTHDCLEVLEQFHKQLTVGGKVYLIDVDGIYDNMGTEDPELKFYLNKLRLGFEGDFFRGRYLPEMLKQAGFKNIHYQVYTMDFQDEERRLEVQQYKERITASMHTIAHILGNDLEALKFSKLFLEKLSDPNIPLFYNKFLIEGEKGDE